MKTAATPSWPAVPDNGTAPGRLLTVDQAAEYLNVGARFVRRLVAERRVPVVRLGRHVRLAQPDLDALVIAGRTPANEPAPLRSHRLVVGGRR